MKKVLHLIKFVFVLLLLQNSFSAYADLGDGNQLSMDFKLVVGRYHTTTQVFTPLALGEEILANQIITVRIIPNNDFWAGATSFVVMFDNAKFTLISSDKAAFTVNNVNNYYANSCTDYSGQTTIPDANWPASFAAGERYDVYKAIKFGTLVDGGAPEYLPGPTPDVPGIWLFQFRIRATHNIVVGTNARIWMDTRWYQSSTNPGVEGYIFKCTDPNNNTIGGTNFSFDFDFTEADIMLALPVPTNTSTITFDVAGGTPEIDPITQDEGTAVTDPADPTRVGFTFMGWVPAVPATMPVDDVTCVAQWEATPNPTSTITFDTDGGNVISPITADEGAPVPIPPDPTKTGFTFQGWVPDIPATMPVDDMTCVAQWAAASSCGVLWTARTAAEAKNWSSVTYGNGLFVAVAWDETGATNTVMTSPDGINWTTRTAANQHWWYSVTYGNGLFVAVALTGSVMTSPDGITWTARSAPESNQWFSVTYGNGLFVAVANDGTNRVMTSPDGITWTARTAAEANKWYSVTYGNGLFVAVAESGTNRVMTSPDGITWTARTAAEANKWYSITYGNGLFVAVANDGINRVMTSPDGITWTARTAAEASAWNSVTYGNSLFVAVANDGINRVMTSPDGITWTARTAAEANGWTSVTSGNGLFVAVAFNGTNRVMTSECTTPNPTSTITFNTDGGSAVSPITQDEGTAVTRPADPTKAGFTFMGWVPDVPETMPVDDVTCVAQWNAIPNPQSTITFDVAGGTPAISPITQDEGTPVTAPADPTRAGYTFMGWVPAVPETMPVDDVTCVAQWEAITNPTSTITFDVAGGTPEIDPITQDEGTAVTAPTDPTKTGFTFLGWVPAVPATMPVDDVTCVAQWLPAGQPLPEYMYYKFDAAGNQTNYASSPVGDNPATLDGLTTGNTGQFGTALIGNELPSTSNRLNTGWATNLPSTGWTISFWVNNFPAIVPTTRYFFGDASTSFRCFTGGVAPVGGLIVRGTGLTDVSIPAIPSSPTVIHIVYTGSAILVYINGVYSTTTAQSSVSLISSGPFLVGGYSSSAASFPVGCLMDEFRMYSRALDATEISTTWNIELNGGGTPPITRTITFNTDGGSAVAPITGNPGTPVTPPVDPTKAGFTFMGWVPDVPETIPENDVTCVAQWEAIPNPQSTITFDVAGGTPAISPITQDEGTPVTAPADPSREGYTFLGWVPAVPETMPVDDVTCVAQWEAITYEVSYHANGGTGNPPTDVNSPYTVGASVTVLGNAGNPPLTKPEHYFNGWNTKAIGSGTAYQPGDNFTMPAGDVTLYAIYTCTQFYEVMVSIRASKMPGNQVKFKAYPINGGNAPYYKWYRAVGSGTTLVAEGLNMDEYITTCQGGDEHWVELISSHPCASGNATAASSPLCTF